MLKWKRLGEDQWLSELDTRFSMNVKKMGDGRWTWKVAAMGAVSHMATGICNFSWWGQAGRAELPSEVWATIETTNASRNGLIAAADDRRT